MKESKPIISTQDISIIKKVITYYLSDGPFLTEKKKVELLHLFHRLERLQ